MRGVTLCLLLWCAASGTAAAGNAWSNLWSTPEQQAQHLLDSRQAAAAAPLFTDPRRRGYAQLRAGQYAQAAKSLAPLRDADSLYNRGNALAHTGQLRDALAAYDAALKQSPGNRDIVHNRDLVAHELQNQQQQSAKGQQRSNGSGAGAGKAGQPDNTASQQGRSGRQQGSGGEQQRNAGTQQGGAGEQQGRSSGQQPGGEQARSAGTQQGTAGQQQGSRGQQSAGGQQPAGAQGQQAAAGNGGQNPATRQAQADSHGQPGGQSGNSAQAGSMPRAASAAQAPSQGQSGVGSQQAGLAQGVDSAAAATTRGRSKSTVPSVAMQDGRSKGATRPPPPRSEQSLALDQWLRGIPDDSGELLRRKFMIEHMMKQRENTP